jgi:serine/threonine-protein kinase HipA
MKYGNVKFYNKRVGIITQTDDGFEFMYDDSYVASDNAEAISLTFPVRLEPYTSSTIFPFF